MSDADQIDVELLHLRWRQARVVWKAARKAARMETRKFQKIDAEYQKACRELGIAPNPKQD